MLGLTITQLSARLGSIYCEMCLKMLLLHRSLTVSWTPWLWEAVKTRQRCLPSVVTLTKHIHNDTCQIQTTTHFFPTQMPALCRGSLCFSLSASLTITYICSTLQMNFGKPSARLTYQTLTKPLMMNVFFREKGFGSHSGNMSKQIMWQSTAKRYDSCDTPNSLWCYKPLKKKTEWEWEEPEGLQICSYRTGAGILEKERMNGVFIGLNTQRGVSRIQSSVVQPSAQSLKTHTSDHRISPQVQTFTD